MFWWNKDLLEEAGFDKPPRTYSEVYELAEKICVPNEVYAMHFLYGNSWWHRWFDFITFYYAAGDGAPYIDVEKQKAVFNNDAAVEVVKFGQTLYENNWTSNELTDNALFEGKLAANLMGTWAIKWGKDTFPEVFPDKILMSAPPVPDNYPEDKPVKSFADTKGMIMFKSTQYKEEAWQFIQWVYSKLEHDKMWLEMTGLPPVRDDLMTNQAFKPFLDENPMLVEFVKQIPYSLPPALTSKTTEVQDLMTTELTEPIFLSDKSAEEIVENAVEVINIELF
jgi:multiple sugar transport system substrate-binding protein